MHPLTGTQTRTHAQQQQPWSRAGVRRASWLLVAALPANSPAAPGTAVRCEGMAPAAPQPATAHPANNTLLPCALQVTSSCHHSACSDSHATDSCRDVQLGQRRPSPTCRGCRQGSSIIHSARAQRQFAAAQCRCGLNAACMADRDGCMPCMGHSTRHNHVDHVWHHVTESKELSEHLQPCCCNCLTCMHADILLLGW